MANSEADVTTPISSNRPAPLWAVQSISFLSSIGTAVVQHGIYFMVERRFGVEDVSLFGLGLLFGLTYLPAALLIAPALERFEARHAWCTPRMVLALVLVLMCSVTVLPVAASWAGLEVEWIWWVTFGIYALASGIHWPILEGFLSGGRRARTLRAATGQFNVIWAGAMALSFIVMGPLVERHQFSLLMVMAGVHLLTPLLLLACPARPPHPDHGSSEPHPPVYFRLLSVFRILLPTSYLVSGTLIPFFPGALARLGVGTQRAVALIAVWHFARVFAFLIMERWHGWHGRWFTPIVGATFMLTGFGACLVAPALNPDIGLPIFIAALIPFGLGMGVIYAAAIYYALEVGHAKVQASGTHESLIGLGMTAGPLCGLAVSGAAAMGWIPESRVEPTLLVVVMAVSVGFGAFAIRSSWRHARGGAALPTASEPPQGL